MSNIPFWGDISVKDNIQFGISNNILFLHNKIYFWNIHINLICICIISSSLRTKILENFCEMEIKEKILFYIFHMTRAVFSKMHTQQLEMRRHHNKLWIAEVARSISLNVRFNPFLMGRHIAIDIREALL